MATFAPSVGQETSHTEQKLPPHLRGICDNRPPPMVEQKAVRRTWVEKWSIPEEKKVWVPPHLRGPVKNRAPPVVEPKAIRRTWTYDANGSVLSSRPITNTKTVSSPTLLETKATSVPIAKTKAVSPSVREAGSESPIIPKTKTVSPSSISETKVVSFPINPVTEFIPPPASPQQVTIAPMAVHDAAEMACEEGSVAQEASPTNVKDEMSEIETSAANTSYPNHYSSSTPVSCKETATTSMAVDETERISLDEASIAMEASLTNINDKGANVEPSSTTNMSDLNNYSSSASTSHEEITVVTMAGNDIADVAHENATVVEDAIDIESSSSTTTNDADPHSSSSQTMMDKASDSSIAEHDSIRWNGRLVITPKRTSLLQQFGSDEDPARFDMTRILQPPKVRDYRFDNDSSCVGNDGDPIDYRNAKDSEGWDIVDPEGVERIRRELAMAHDNQGNWRAIEDWDGRPGFRNDSAFFQGALNWMERCVKEAFEDPINFDTSHPLYISGEAGPTGTDHFLLDPIALENHHTERPDDGFTLNPKNSEQTAFKASQVVTKLFHEKKEMDRAKRRERRKAREAFNASARAYIPPPNLYVPKINMYLRPATEKDMQQVSDIYNHHVNNGPVATDVISTTRDDWVARWRLTEGQQHLPFVIAVCKSKRTSSTSRQKHRHNALPEENIVGFSWAEDYLGMNTTYGGTVELHTYVHPGHLRMGIGKNLVDIILEAVDCGHSFHNGCEFKTEDTESFRMGGIRRPECILINIPFYPDKEEALIWQKEWLWTHLYFDQVATIPALGKKNGTTFNVAMFMRVTGAGGRYFPRTEMTGKPMPLSQVTGFTKPT